MNRTRALLSDALYEISHPLHVPQTDTQQPPEIYPRGV